MLGLCEQAVDFRHHFRPRPGKRFGDHDRIRGYHRTATLWDANWAAIGDNHDPWTDEVPEMSPTLRTASFLTAALVAATFASPASAQEWPPRTTSIVLGLGPGSGLDLFARVIVDALQTKLGTNFVLDYRVGAGGNIAVEHVARSVADGSVLGGAIAAPIVTNPMFMKLSIEPLKELAPVTVLGTIPSVVIASKKSGARSMQDFIAMLRRDPGKYTFSSVGIGTTGHLSVELIALKSGTKMVHVPYKSTPEALQAVMTGEVDMATLTVNLTEQAILTDKVTGIAITSARRWPTLPDIPTIAEAGITDMPVDAWFGLFAPAKTPAAIIDKIAQEVRAIEQIPEVRKRIEGTFYRPVANTPAEFAALLRQEQVTWKRVVETIGLK